MPVVGDRETNSTLKTFHDGEIKIERDAIPNYWYFTDTSATGTDPDTTKGDGLTNPGLHGITLCWGI